MAGFSDLPNELVGEVAGHVMPEDIESFSMLSRGVYVIALPLLREHRLLRERYNVFGNLKKAAFDGELLKKANPGSAPVTANCAPGDSFSNLLTDVLKNHRVAPYIKEFRQEGWFTGWDSMGLDPLDETLHLPYSEEQFSLFKQALSRYVLPTKLKTWIEELESGHEDPIISLLFIFLPNINSIKFENCSNLAHRLREVVERIETDCIPDIPILSHLERINLQYDDYYIEGDPRPIDFLAFIATMPSLKSLSGQFIATFGEVHDFSCLSPHSSTITELRFKKCNLNLEKLRDLFQGLKALQRFHYIYDRYDEYTGYLELWDPAGMCKALSKYFQGSLEVLDLRSDLEPVGPIESLCDYSVLKDLTLSFSLFKKGQFLCSETLASQLPESIQKISLHDVEIKHIWFLESTIREVLHLKPARLPRLKDFCFFASWDLEALGPVKEELRKLCEEAGVELCFLKPN